MAHNEHAAGGLEGLNLGTPIGGSSTAHGFTSGSSTTAHTTGLTTGSSHLDKTGDAHRTSTSAAAANVTKPGYDNADARNTTSGERGIGGGHGGPTAFESNPERVGTDRKHDAPHNHTLGGLTGSTVEEVQRRGSGVVRSGDHDLHGKETRGDTFGELDNTKTHGHHDHAHDRDVNTSSRTGVAPTGSNVPVVPTGDRTGSNVPAVGGAHAHSHHTTGAATAGGLAAGAGAATLIGGPKPSPYEGVVGDSVTGQQHFKGGNAGLTTGVPVTATVVGTPAPATGVSPGTLAGSHGHHEHSKETGLVAELKQELKEHQKHGGYSDSDKHPESDGPHGLVWHNGKYVHKRELDNHGSTGVPLK